MKTKWNKVLVGGLCLACGFLISCKENKQRTADKQKGSSPSGETEVAIPKAQLREVQKEITKKVQISEAEKEIRQYIDTRVNKAEGGYVFDGTLKTNLGTIMDIWELKGPSISVKQVALSEADKLNGKQESATFELICRVYRKRGLYPSRRSEWSKWEDGGVMFRGGAIKENGQWTIKCVKGTLIGDSEFIISKPEVREARESQKMKDDQKRAQIIAESKTTPQNTLTVDQLAKDKNVPVVVKSPQGDFTLAAVVEGEDANQSLHRSLQVVGVQRQRLAQLSREYDQTAPAKAQQRELLTRQINETRMTFEKNLRYMAQNFAYVLSNNYILVPHEATLSLVEGVGKDQKKSLVYTFKDAASYEGFRKKSEAYAKLKQGQLKANQPTTGKAPTQLRTLTPVMKMAQAEMIRTYQCDPEKNYLVEYQKTALYARKAK